MTPMVNFIFMLLSLLLLQCHGYKIKQIVKPVQHAEGPVWCPLTKTLVFVNTFQATIYRLQTKSNIKLDSYKMQNHSAVGFVIKRKGSLNNLLVFAERSIYDLKWPLNNKVQLKKILSIENNKPTNQFNDGKADSEGRVWAGTLTRKKDLSASPHGGSLYMIDQNLTVYTKLTNISISNGLIWNKNNSKFYFIDSITKCVDEFDYEELTGRISNHQVIVNITEEGYSGIPDGMTIDENDNLWIALYGGSHVIQINPRTRKIEQKIKLPVTYVTSLTWGGTNYDILFVTTSRLHLTALQSMTDAVAGSVFAITGLGVKGLPAKEAVF